jgi:tripartite-type tricarboxylate transporter receptor subunit TctC
VLILSSSGRNVTPGRPNFNTGDEEPASGDTGMRRRVRFWIACTMLLALSLPVAAPAANGDDDFYRGKTISLIIPIGPGGAYDTYARLVARHLGKGLPGNPVIIPRNMPGAGGTIASNYVYNLAPQDGTTLTIITSSFAMEQLFENPQIRYDARKFIAIGRLLDTTSVIFFWHTSPIKTVDDLRERPSTVGISGVNEMPAARMRAMNRFLGMQMRLIPGYPSARDYVMAVEREETDGGTSTYIGLSQLFASYLREKKLNIVVQFGLTRDPNMPDIPTVIELTDDPEVRQIFSRLVSNDTIGRSLFTSPNVPPARVELLRIAFSKMLADPEFNAEAERLSLPLLPKSGEEMQKVVLDTLDVSPTTLAKIREVMKP